MTVRNVSRRAVLLGLGGLVLVPVVTCWPEPPPSDGPTFGWTADGAPSGHMFGVFLRVATDGSITVRLPSTEMGQGIVTSLPMLVAEELGIAWKQVRVEPAPTHAAYRRWTPIGAMQVTGSSLSIRSFFEPMRQAGAAARTLLIQAAADRWGVPTAACTVASGIVHHAESSRSLPIGELVEAAAELPVPDDVPLKPPSEFRLVGTDPRRLDTEAKCTGAAVFGIDVHRPGMRYASLRQAPFGGAVAAVDDAAARAASGVLDVLVFEDFVAVVAESTWQALRGVELLDITWDAGDDSTLDDAAIRERIVAALDEPGRTHHVHGDALDALADAETVVEAAYFVPYLDQAGMEPLCCTAEVRDDRVELWAPTQTQTETQKYAARASGRSKDDVHVHTTFVGGGFGRRVEWDFTTQAVRVAMQVDGPVQLVWSRPEVFGHGFYRPAVGGRLRAAIDEQGYPRALSVRVAGTNLARHYLPRLLQGVPPAEKVMVEGFDTYPYRTEHRHIAFRHVGLPVPTGFMRSAGFGHNAFFRECFLDELAHRADLDPVDYRLAMLAESPRSHRLLARVAELASWDAPAGRFLGVALQESYDSIVAMIASVRLQGRAIVVDDVYATVDCGIAIHPDNVRYQVEGGIAFGLCSTLHTQINIANKRVVQTNFHQYPLVRMSQMPRVHIELLSSDSPPGGVGEIGVSPVAPAVANALFAATGERLRELPLRPGLA